MKHKTHVITIFLGEIHPRRWDPIVWLQIKSEPSEQWLEFETVGVTSTTTDQWIELCTHTHTSGGGVGLYFFSSTFVSFPPTSTTWTAAC